MDLARMLLNAEADINAMVSPINTHGSNMINSTSIVFASADFSHGVFFVL